VPLPRKFMNFSSQNGVIWCILGVLFLRFICPMDCSCMINFIDVPEVNTCQNIGGRQHRTTPAGQILGVATSATPAALTPMRSTVDEFVDNTIDLPRRNFLSPSLGKSPRGSTLILEILEFLMTQYRITEMKHPVPPPLLLSCFSSSSSGSSAT